MANSKYVPPLIAAGLGVSIMTYTFFGGGENAPELTGKSPGPKPESGLGQSAIDSKNGKGGATSQPSPPLQSGGASPNKATEQTVAGTSASSRKGYSADHDVKLKDSKTGIHDGSDGGGVGVAEMRERKMKGQGLPSPQGGDTKAQVTPAAMNQGEGGNQPKPQNGRWWLGGW